jgi:hypothetical protein
MYQYLGAYRWAPDKVYACPDHVEQLALCHRTTASDIHPTMMRSRFEQPTYCKQTTMQQHCTPEFTR